MDTDIVTIYCICDDLLEAVHDHENGACRMSDAEVMTAGVVSAFYFGGHHQLACDFLKDHGYIPAMLSHSRFNRWLHHLAGQIEQLIQVLGAYWQQTNAGQLYAVDIANLPDYDPIVSSLIKAVRLYSMINQDHFREY